MADQRRLDEELVAQIRQKLSAAQFHQAFSDGSGLTQRQAIDIVRDERGTGGLHVRDQEVVALSRPVNVESTKSDDRQSIESRVECA